MTRKIKQSDIIKLNLSPTKGHEQAGFRPVLVISNDCFNTRTNLLLVCPISTTINGFPMHVELIGTSTTGEIRCEQVKVLDPKARPFTFVEAVPKCILLEAVDIVYGSVKILD